MQFYATLRQQLERLRGREIDSAGALPPGLSLSQSGEISGTPTVVGVSTFTVELTSGGQAVSQQLMITVYDPLSITTSALPT